MIKFRAWDKGNEIYLYNVQYACIQLCFADFLEEYRYDLEQFTGLKDVNGKDIYEGDIIRVLSINVISDVKYMRDGTTPEFEIDRQKVFDDENVFGEAAFKGDIEVIGNVHENPELLEESK